ncbi:hypothetical protein FAY30_12160 [Bacillus sp. S3]|uniref:hypothetical protein n=1 Tax=Bacillus sp. S3 TaxID=486398 RepID=UPI001189CAC3|nr:hypothetical protein [Bacillus sp. S3]QCJ42601.1 hypothetical protein FAY30_12160 [Bacillus sp. S3]
MYIVYTNLQIKPKKEKFGDAWSWVSRTMTKELFCSKVSIFEIKGQNKSVFVKNRKVSPRGIDILSINNLIEW